MPAKRLTVWGVALLVISVAAFAAVQWPSWLSDADPPAPLVAQNLDPQVPGDWLIIYPDGLVLAVSQPHERYPRLGAPTVEITALHYGDEPVAVGFPQFLGLVGGEYRSFIDGEPALGVRQLEPRQAHQGRMVLYGAQALDGLLIARDGQRLSIDFSSSDYAGVESVPQALFQHFNR